MASKLVFSAGVLVSIDLIGSSTKKKVYSEKELISLINEYVDRVDLIEMKTYVNGKPVVINNLNQN